MHTTAIIMAAGKGTRMRSELPKVLHPFRGGILIDAPINAAREVSSDIIVVVGHAAEQVRAALPQGVISALQAEQRGTGDAVRCALASGGADANSVLVLPGDHPRVDAKSLALVVARREETDAVLALATVSVDDFEGERISFADYGRIIRSADGDIVRIVEKKDANDVEMAVREVNASYYCFRGTWLRENIARLEPNNAAGELYLTDLIALAQKHGEKIVGVPLPDYREAMGVNTPEQLLAAEQA